MHKQDNKIHRALQIAAKIDCLLFQGVAIPTRSSATAEIVRVVDDVKRPFKVIEAHPLLCQSTRHEC